MATGAVEFAEPNYLVEPSIAPKDPGYKSQWHLSRIRMPAAWTVITDSSNIKIAVCDTGVNSNHPDLKANLTLPGYNVVDGTTDTIDIHGHGTMTTGTLAAIGNNSLETTGIAWRASVLPIKVSNDISGISTYGDLATCIRYAADQGAKVVSLSYNRCCSRVELDKNHSRAISQRFFYRYPRQDWGKLPLGRYRNIQLLHDQSNRDFARRGLLPHFFSQS